MGEIENQEMRNDANDSGSCGNADIGPLVVRKHETSLHFFSREIVGDWEKTHLRIRTSFLKIFSASKN